jgi:diguanylate cyclase (GGDEF)-like protein/PAS domain S-box-containing protein
MAPAIRPPLRLVLIERSDGYAAVVASLLAAEPDPPELVRFARLEEALRHLTRAETDCVLLDAEDLDGASRILDVAPAMPFVVLTPDADEEEAVRVLRAGAQDHVVKGTESGARIMRSVRHAIERRHTGDRRQVERLVREVVDEVGRLPERRAKRRLRRRRGGAMSRDLAPLRGILDGTSDALTVKDVDGRYLLVNDAAAALLGTTADAAVGHTDDELVPPDISDARQARDRAVLATGVPQRYWRTATYGGIERTHSVVKLPYRDGDGQIRGVVTLSRDETAMRRLEEETARFFDLAPDMLCTAGPDGHLERINDVWTRVLGWTGEELRSRPLIDFVHPEDRALAGHEMELMLAGLIDSCTNRVATKAGGWRNLEWSARVVPEERRVYGVARDVTERDAMARALVESEARYRTLVHNLPGSSVITFDHDLRFTFAAGEALVTTESEMLGRSLREVLPHAAHRLVGRYRATLGGETQAFEYPAADGSTYWVQMAPLRDGDGRVTGGMVLTQDITDRRAVERHLQHLADHDPLTGLLNRRRFEVELTRHVTEIERYGPQGALLVLDLDDFKLVNDSLGHSAGDELIQAVAEILRGQLRESDVVARLGGDEFAVLLPRGTGDDALAVAGKLVRAVREEATMVGGDHVLRVTTSIGIAVFAADRVSGEEMLINADLAMYDAKEAGRDGFAVHVPDGDARPRVQARMRWLETIRDAVANDRLALHAQPIRDLRSGDVAQYELLVRLRDASGDLIPPAAFLPIAERYDLVQLIDRWVVGQALELLAAHAGTGLRLTVNLSGRTLSDAGLLETLERELARTGADADCLTFEVTETAAVSNIHRAREFAERLREIGCRFALDDFGAGFGSFYYLKHLPFDYLKIDGEFVANCLSNRTDQLVIRAVVDIAQGLGKETVAEFASDPELVHFLAMQGVDYAQGFEIGRPEPLEDVIAGLSLARSR